jgi:hypothetical protein
MPLIPCLSGTSLYCVCLGAGRQVPEVEPCVANFEQIRRLRRFWQIFL